MPRFAGAVPRPHTTLKSNGSSANSRRVVTSHAGNGEGNGESYWNSGQEGRHDATLRFEGRCAAGDGVAGGTVRDYAAQDQHQRRLRVGTDWPRRVCEGKESDQADAG